MSKCRNEIQKYTMPKNYELRMLESQKGVTLVHKNTLINYFIIDNHVYEVGLGCWFAILKKLNYTRN